MPQGVELRHTLEGHPYAWPRPRGKRGQGGYVPRDHPAYLHKQAWIMVLRFAGQGLFLVVPVGVRIAFYYKGSSGDGDNMEKLVLDALQEAGVITNDRQVRRMEWRREHIRDAGRTGECTELEVYEL